MLQRLTFKCHKCHRNYDLTKDIKGTPKLTMSCPFCGAKAVVDLNLYRTSQVDVFKGGDDPMAEGEELNLPKVIPTEAIE